MENNTNIETTSNVVTQEEIVPTPFNAEYDELSTIISVKESSNGWLLNGNTYVPNADDNKDCQLVKRWLSVKGNKPEPEFTSDEIELTRINNIKQKAGEIITSRYPAYKQQNVALGLETKEYSDAMKKFIKDIKVQSTKLEKDVTKTSDDFIVGE